MTTQLEEISFKFKDNISAKLVKINIETSYGGFLEGSVLKDYNFQRHIQRSKILGKKIYFVEPNSSNIFNSNYDYEQLEKDICLPPFRCVYGFCISQQDSLSFASIAAYGTYVDGKFIIDGNKSLQEICAEINWKDISEKSDI